MNAIQLVNKELESRGVRMVGACIGGSRMRGLADEDSDTDVLAIYAHPLSTYLGVVGYPETFTGKFEAERVEFMAYDVRKWGYMVSASNLTAITMLQEMGLDDQERIYNDCIDPKKIAYQAGTSALQYLKRQDTKGILHGLILYQTMLSAVEGKIKYRIPVCEYDVWKLSGVPSIEFKDGVCVIAQDAISTINSLLAHHLPAMEGRKDRRLGLLNAFCAKAILGIGS